MSFSDLGLHGSFVNALSRLDIKTPTSIQEKSIPALLEGRDVLATAPTGTGKSLAFILPMLSFCEEYVRSKPKPTGKDKGRSTKGCTALVLSPTRELAIQLFKGIRSLTHRRNLSAALVIGGEPMHRQRRAIADGADILIATPGRLIDHMENSSFRGDQTRFLVLDEADQMFDMGFMPSMKQILKSLPEERQTALFSATMPKAIRSFAREILTDPVEVSQEVKTKVPDQIEQSVVQIPAREKYATLRTVLDQLANQKVVAFTRTKRRADAVSRMLEEQGHAVYCIHGNKTQGQRKKALTAFSKPGAGVLVATDIAARGIHVDGISHVVNIDLPTTAESYVHRIGRTARAGTTGTAISFCAPEERSLLKDIEKLIGNSLAVNSEPLPRDTVAEAKKPSGKKARTPSKRRDQAKPNSTHNSTGDTPMNTGTVKWFNETKGYGFITPDNGGNDVFVHISAVERAGLSTLAEGAKIEYEIREDPKRGKSSADKLNLL